MRFVFIFFISRSFIYFVLRVRAPAFSTAFTRECTRVIQLPARHRRRDLIKITESTSKKHVLRTLRPVLPTWFATPSAKLTFACRHRPPQRWEKRRRPLSMRREEVNMKGWWDGELTLQNVKNRVEWRQWFFTVLKMGGKYIFLLFFFNLWKERFSLGYKVCA